MRRSNRALQGFESEDNEMLVESLAVIAVVFALAFTFLRAGKKDYATGMLPLLILPAVNIFLSYIAKFFSDILNVQYNTVAICVLVLALIASCIMIGLCGGNISRKSHRTVYFIICGIFALVLSMFFILNIL